MKRSVIISNVCIAAVLLGLGIVMFTTDLSSIFLTVGAPIYNGDRNKQNIAIMFMLDENSTFVPEITELLTEKDVEATFFISGKWAESVSPQLVKDLAQNFEVGNYGYTGRSLAKLSEANQRKELEACHFRVKALTAGTPINTQAGNQVTSGIEMKLFLPPEGSFNKKTLRSAEKMNYKTVMWSKDASNTQSMVFEHATSGILNGDMVILRPNAATFGALGNILDYYKGFELNIVRVSDIIS